MTALGRAKSEEENRRKSLYKEAKKLEQIVQNLDYNIYAPYPCKESILKIIADDVRYISDLKADIKDLSPSWPLKTNKLAEIFECTSILLSEDFEAAIAGNLMSIYQFDPNSRAIFYGTKDIDGTTINYFGTSKLNCIQNTYFTILRFFINVTDIRDFVELQEAGIYDVYTSPNIQTTRLPNNLNEAPYESWFYYYKGNAAVGELLIPNLGYAFGGSRVDVHYRDKGFKTEDCSSAVAKWIGAAKPFPTYAMFLLYNDSSDCEKDDFCVAAKDSLVAVKEDISHIKAGYIFLYRSHTGMVTGNYPKEEILETLSYNRDMPGLEGLGYKNHSYTEKEFFFFEEKANLLGEQIEQHEEL